MSEHKNCSNHTHSSNLCVLKVPIFNHLTKSEMKEIASATKSVTYKRGEIIYHADDPATGLYVVHRGRIKIYRLADTGKEQLVRILDSGDFTGELSLFSESNHDAYAEAMITTEVCLIDRTDFQQFLQSYPEISIKLLAEFSRRLATIEKQAASIALDSAETRIAAYLSDLATRENKEIVQLPMSRKDLASHLATTPETVSRKLTEFVDAGLIKQLSQRKIQIMDLEGLLTI